MSANFLTVKAAKGAFVEEYVNNHPHRLSSIQLSGSVNYEWDARNSTQDFGYKETLNVNLSSLPSWTRVYEEELPVIEAGIHTDVGVFGLTHSDKYFWRFEFALGTPYDEVVVGQHTITNYYKPVISYDPFIEGPWEETSSETTDITASWNPVIGFNYRGGDPVSGGRGADNVANSAGIEAAVYLNGNFNFGGFGFVPEGIAYRLPWQDSWASESASYSESMADFLEERNEFSGGGWTGSTSMRLVFT